MKEQIAALTTLIRGLAGWHVQPKPNAREMRALLTDILENGNEQDREAFAVFLTWLSEWRGTD